MFFFNVIILLILNVSPISMFSNVCLYSWFLTGPEGDLRVYLERLAEAQNVQEYVAQHPFGQRSITESDPSWGFYSRIASAYSY